MDKDNNKKIQPLFCVQKNYVLGLYLLENQHKYTAQDKQILAVYDYSIAGQPWQYNAIAARPWRHGKTGKKGEANRDRYHESASKWKVWSGSA